MRILGDASLDENESVNITDEEKEKLRTSLTQSTESNRPFLDTVLSALDCNENDYLALLALCLIYALANNKGDTIISIKWFIHVPTYIYYIHICVSIV